MSEWIEKRLGEVAPFLYGKAIDTVSENCNIKYLYYYMQLMNLGSYNNDAAVPGLNRKSYLVYLGWILEF